MNRKQARAVVSWPGCGPTQKSKPESPPEYIYYNPPARRRRGRARGCREPNQRKNMG